MHKINMSNNIFIKTHKISMFDQIIVLPNSLVIMDIDQTIITYQLYLNNSDWWNHTYNSYLNTLQNKQLAHDNTLKDIHNHILTNDPIMIDKDGFDLLFKRIQDNQSKLIFLTARDEYLRSTTFKGLQTCQIDVDPNDIHHSMFKGKKIIEILNQNLSYSNLVFVDDYSHNIKDVELELNKYLNLIKSTDTVQLTELNQLTNIDLFDITHDILNIKTI